MTCFVTFDYFLTLKAERKAARRFLHRGNIFQENQKKSQLVTFVLTRRNWKLQITTFTALSNIWKPSTAWLKSRKVMNYPRSQTNSRKLWTLSLVNHTLQRNWFLIALRKKFLKMPSWFWNQRPFETRKTFLRRHLFYLTSATEWRVRHSTIISFWRAILFQSAKY